MTQHENVFTIKYIDSNEVESFSIDKEIPNCTTIPASSTFVQLVEKMTVRDTSVYQNRMFKLVYKGNNVKSVSLLQRKVNINYIFFNIKKANELREDKINYYDYYCPDEKYENGTYSDQIIKGLKRYPTIDYHNNYKGYFKEFENMREIFINNFLKKYNIEKDYMIVCVPSCEVTDKNKDALALMIESICKRYGYVDGSQILKRIIEIEPQKHAKKRCQETHINSIEVKGSVIDKKIILIDDITTSGCSLLACKRILLDAGARKIITFAFSKTK